MTINDQLLQDASENVMALQGQGTITLDGVEATDQQLVDQTIYDLVTYFENKKAANHLQATTHVMVND